MTGSGKAYLTLDDFDLRGKTVLLRVDINSPIVDGRIAGTDRIEAAGETVHALAEGGARTVILAHQGRRGDPDFTTMEEHAEVLAGFTKTPVKFVADVAGPDALAAIDGVANGEALMLDNVRGLEEETRKVSSAEHAQAGFVKALAAKADVYVNDAFSAAHRTQATLVGFAPHVPSAAGLTMDRELTALAKAVDEPEAPAVYFLGGAKPEDSIAVMRANFEKGTLDTALLGGVVANLFMHVRGHDLGKPTLEFMKKKGVLDLVPEAEALLKEHDEGIYTPQDVAVKNGQGERENVWMEDLPKNYPILDIGEETAKQYAELVQEAGSLMMNGPAGLYEEKPYHEGTRKILTAFARSDAFSLMGGGHTITAIGEFGFTEADFGYVSLAGGALMAYLTGKPLPAVEALKQSKEKFASG